MEPFRVVCPQCSSKIIVRHAHLVGQILPCPKCKHRFEIQLSNLPADSTVPTPSPSKPILNAASINSSAMTKVDPADWNLDNLPELAQPADPLHRTHSNPASLTGNKSDTDPFGDLSSVPTDQVIFEPLNEALSSVNRNSSVPNRNSPTSKNRTQTRWCTAFRR